MKDFLSDDFLLSTPTAVTLYNDFAKDLPIIDYHCHLPVDQIAQDLNFKNLTQVWLYGDHYKWRAMRANGVAEQYITGDRSDFEKFEKWAETVPFTIRNPLYHWTHLELRRYFDVNEILSPATAKKIYDECSEKLQSPEFSVRSLMRKMKVEMTGTTDDPLDNLVHHKKISDDGFEIKVLPSFRPDKAMNADNIPALNEYIDQLSAITGSQILSFSDYEKALKVRHDYFAQNGCRISDHGLEHFYAEDYTTGEIEVIFKMIRSNEVLSHEQVMKFKSCMLFKFGLWDHEKGWIQQYHVGGLRNNNIRLLKKIGADAGLDSIGDFTQGVSMTRFLNRLDEHDRLAQTIIYNLNPADNELIAAMVGNFNDGTIVGKIQFGSAWWFLDQKDGMIKQLNALSNIGLLSRFVGMLTDSRSFLSYPRHEYFRRILCDLIGKDVENGELPNDIPWLGKIVRDICYYNAKAYFKL